MLMGALLSYLAAVGAGILWYTGVIRDEGKGYKLFAVTLAAAYVLTGLLVLGVR